MKHKHVYPDGIEIRREVETVIRSSDPVDVACGVALRLFERTDDVWGLRNVEKTQEQIDEDRVRRLKRSIAEAEIVLEWARKQPRVQVGDDDPAAAAKGRKR